MSNRVKVVVWTIVVFLFGASLSRWPMPLVEKSDTQLKGNSLQLTMVIYRATIGADNRMRGYSCVAVVSLDQEPTMKKSVEWSAVEQRSREMFTEVTNEILREVDQSVCCNQDHSAAIATAFKREVEKNLSGIRVSGTVEITFEKDEEALASF